MRHLKHLLKNVPFLKAGYDLLRGRSDNSRKPEFSIGIYAGETPFALKPAENVKNPVLTARDISDVPADFVADPFMLKVEDTWFMFFEALRREPEKGEIGLATSEDGIAWKYQQVVLAEPFHLSYPYVFKWKNDFYMIPESYQAGAVRLYKAVKFPTQWVFVGNLLTGRPFVDASVFCYKDIWWLFTETSSNYKNDTLRLYFADELRGPWAEHPMSPIIKGNPHIARPAGRVLILDQKIVRFTQDCHPNYGLRVHAFEILELTKTCYRERKLGDGAILLPGGDDWNAHGMHHIDLHPLGDSWIACVDGWSYTDADHEGGMMVDPKLKEACSI